MFASQLTNIVGSSGQRSDEKARLASLITPMLWGSVIILMGDAVFTVLFEPQFLSNLWVNGLSFCLIITLLLMMKRGFVYLVGGVLCLSTWLTTVYNTAITGGLVSPNLNYLAFLIVAGFLIYGPPGSLIMCVLDVLAVIGFYISRAGAFGFPTNFPSVLELMGGHLSFLAGLTVILAIGGRSFYHAVRQARMSERLLAERNWELQGEIVERKRIEEILRESEEKFRTILDLVPFGAFVIGMDGKFILANEAAIHQIGGTPSNLIGQSLIEIGWMKTPNQFDDLVQRMKAMGKLDTEEFTVVDLDGQPVEMLFSGRFITLAGKKYIILITIDIRERKKAEQQATELTLEQEKARIIKDFISDISHDLMTPITVILTSTYVADKLMGQLVNKLATPEMFHAQESFRLASLSLAKDAEAIRTRYVKIDDNALRIQNLIRRMIEMVEVDGRTTYKLADHDLNHLVEQIIESQLPVAQEKAIKIDFYPCLGLPLVRVDHVEFERAIQNLLGNALTYTLPNGKITVNISKLEQSAVLEVKDTGIGIPAHALPHIFERFYRVDAARGIGGGSGLGLAITRKIVAGHGGKISVESTAGIGSSFKVTLPLQSLELINFKQ